MHFNTLNNLISKFWKRKKALVSSLWTFCYFCSQCKIHQ